MGLKLDIKDVNAIEVDLISNTVKCLTVTGFILWQTRKETVDEALEVAGVIDRKGMAYLKSISKA